MILYPKLLVFSTNSLRRDGSNGKIIGELLFGWPSERIAQFYTYAEYPDSDVCDNFYRVTNAEAVKSLLPFKKVGGIVSNQIKDRDIIHHSKDNLDGKRKPRKNPLTLLVRDLVWGFHGWESKQFWGWIKAFAPDVILLQAGESSYLHRIVLRVAKRIGVPFVILNTENYYMKNYNYLVGHGWEILYPIYKAECDKAFRCLMKNSAKEIYTNSVLDAQYYKSFGRHGIVIYQGSSLSEMPDVRNTPPIISYAGNLGVNRHSALIELAEALVSVNSEAMLDVYGRAPSEEVQKALESVKGLRYHGVVAYSKVLEVMRNSDYMVHVESNDPFWSKDLCAAFSTKISDILSAGKCLILYASPFLACSRFIADNHCGFLIQTKDQLIPRLKELLDSRNIKQELRNNALITAKEYFDSSKNAAVFLRVINDVVKLQLV